MKPLPGGWLHSLTASELLEATALAEKRVLEYQERDRRAQQREYNFYGPELRRYSLPRVKK